MLPEREDEDVGAAARELRRYLAAHPQAADSIEGVVKWWLGRPDRPRERDVVRRALERLIAEGAMKKTRTVAGKTIYASRRDPAD